MTAGELIAWGGSGVVLGGAFLRFARRGDEARERRVLAVGLLVAAAAYVVFALAYEGAVRLLVELSGAALFAGLAYASAQRSSRRSWSRLLAVGWAAHGLWDGLLHLSGLGYGPQWYAALCVGFDFVVAGGLAVAVAGVRRAPVVSVAQTVETRKWGRP